MQQQSLQSAAPSNQPATAAQEESTVLSQPPAPAAQAWPVWLVEQYVDEKGDFRSDGDANAWEFVNAMFWHGRPMPAQDVYAALMDEDAPCRSKTAICPMALKMGIRKVKRKSGWWWVPPGAKEPTLAATREDPWAEAPPQNGT